jgi:DNA primase
MENSKFVLGLLESVLGKGKPSKNGDVDFYCPICNHKKRKLVVNIESGIFHCWTCFPQTKGRNPVSLLKKLGVEQATINEMRGYFNESKVVTNEEENPVVTLPSEFVSLNSDSPSIEMRHALIYLQKRGIDKKDVIKYNIGYCETGRYRGRVVIPSYDENCNIKYFIARAISEDTMRKYDTPKCKKSEIIGFENLINFDAPIILCEGAFDAIAIKRNAIPLFGKTIPTALMKKLAKHSVKTIYLAMDKDAIRDALHSAEKLIQMGKDVYLLDIEEKDPSNLGFEKITQLLHLSKQLTFENLFSIKMGMALK